MRFVLAPLASIVFLAAAAPAQIYEAHTPASVTALTIRGNAATVDVWRIYANLPAMQHLQWRASYDGYALRFAGHQFFGNCKPMRVDYAAAGAVRLDDGAGHTASLDRRSKSALDLAVHRLSVIKHLQAAQPLLKIPLEVAFGPACGR